MERTPAIHLRIITLIKTVAIIIATITDLHTITAPVAILHILLQATMVVVEAVEAQGNKLQRGRVASVN